MTLIRTHSRRRLTLMCAFGQFCPETINCANNYLSFGTSILAFWRKRFQFCFHLSFQSSPGQYHFHRAISCWIIVSISNFGTSDSSTSRIIFDYSLEHERDFNDLQTLACTLINYYKFNWLMLTKKKHARKLLWHAEARACSFPVTQVRTKSLFNQLLAAPWLTFFKNNFKILKVSPFGRHRFLKVSSHCSLN